MMANQLKIHCYYHYARLIETLFAAERVRVLLDDPDILSNQILNTKHNFQGEGVGVIEAPRGTLNSPLQSQTQWAA